MMLDPDDFNEALDPKNWTAETTLNAPTFKATIQEDGTLWITGAALKEGFDAEAAQALTRFLAAHVELPPQEPPDFDLGDYTPKRVI